MPFIETDKGKIHYKISGSGDKTLVFLHGFLGNLHVWDRYIPYIKNQYTIIQVDLPGHGLSTVFSDIHTMELMAEKVYAVLSKLEIDRAHFIGHSMGGYVSLAYRYKYKKQVQSITLFNSTATEDSPQKKKDRIRTIRVIEMAPELFVNEAINNLFAEDNLKSKATEVAELKKIALSVGLLGSAPALHGMAERKNMINDLKGSEIPILFIAGVHDNVIPIESAKNQASLLGAELTVLEEAGHMGFVEAFQETLDSMINFWSKNQ